MQMTSLVIFTVLGMALFAGLSLTLHRALPWSVLQRSARHGRFAGLAARGRADRRPAGKVPAADYETLQGQSV